LRNPIPTCPTCNEPYETDGQSYACANPVCPEFNVWYDPPDLNLEDDLDDASDEWSLDDDYGDDEALDENDANDDQPRLF
jgi:hypothetical protein